MIKFAIPAGKYIRWASDSRAPWKDRNEYSCMRCREDEVHIPSGDFILQQGDVISVVASHKIAREFLSHIGFETKQVKNTMIIGGGKAAYYLAKNLLDVGLM